MINIEKSKNGYWIESLSKRKTSRNYQDTLRQNWKLESTVFISNDTLSKLLSLNEFLDFVRNQSTNLQGEKLFKKT